MLLSNILITSSPDDGEHILPAVLKQNVESLKRQHPELPYRLFVERDVIELIEQKFTPEIMTAYHAMRPFSYRSDLARYCILYEYGGVYADLSYFFLGPVTGDGDRPVVFRGNLVSAPWDTSSGLVFSPPKHKAFQRAIELLCANVEKRYYGLNALCPTGPTLLGKALASTCEAEELTTGHAKHVERETVKQLVPNLLLPRGPHIHCQYLGGAIVAIKRKAILGRGLEGFGITTGNTYRDIWGAGEVYIEPGEKPS